MKLNTQVELAGKRREPLRAIAFVIVRLCSFVIHEASFHFTQLMRAVRLRRSRGSAVVFPPTIKLICCLLISIMALPPDVWAHAPPVTPPPPCSGSPCDCPPGQPPPSTPSAPPLLS